MPLINKQPNAILKFCPIDILLVRSWWQYDDRFRDAKFDTIRYKYIRVNLPQLSRFFFFAYFANYSGSLSFVAEW